MAYRKNITDEEARAIFDERLRRLEAILEKLMDLSPASATPKHKGRGGRPRSPVSEATLKPWEAEGGSRNTWYARKRERKIFEEGRKAASAKPSPEDDPW